MDKSVALSRLKQSEAALRKLGIEQLSLFGSTARGEAGPSSDIDLAAIFAVDARVGLFRYAAIAERLEEILGVPVDLVGEPARKARMQAEIDRDRVRVF